MQKVCITARGGASAVSEVESAASVEGGICKCASRRWVVVEYSNFSYLGEVYIAFGIEYNYVKCLSL